MKSLKEDKKLLKKLKKNGVYIINPNNIYISLTAKIGPYTTIYPGAHILGKTKIGAYSVIGYNSIIKNSIIGERALIKENCVIEDSIIENLCEIGPFAHLRPKTIIKSGAKIGNFVELKKSTIGKNSKAMHLSYIGDAEIEKNVNIGAGTITCNYDGEKKHKTTIEDNVFIGSGTELVAPVKIGKNAYVGAGSTITKDVPPHALAIARGRQVNKDQWVKVQKLRARLKKELTEMGYYKRIKNQSPKKD